MTTAGTDFNCVATLVPNGGDFTTDFPGDPVLRPVEGQRNCERDQRQGTHLGGSRAPVPVIFGMNFQAAQRWGEVLIENGVVQGWFH